MFVDVVYELNETYFRMNSSNYNAKIIWQSIGY